MTERNPNIRISAKVTGSHGAILRKDFRAVADAVRKVTALNRSERCRRSSGEHAKCCSA
ncbi:hypothetical protein ACGFMK_23815 [Amycolatopsis sp. NPDC049252]|uniref:hypothetical protein n=1 Tax=Amycolatopsis sp. NPDC049252 TaxID=3363933 RepID=UPI00371F2A07